MPTKKIENYSLWKRFKEDKEQEVFDELINEYLPLVKYLTGRIKMIVPAHVEEDDLISYGVIGLIDAIHKFDYKKGIKFKTYASRRIRGEIIDHLRKMDWLPHSLRREGKRLKEIADSFMKKQGRKPSLEELSELSNLSIKKINKLYKKIYSAQWLSLYDEFGDGKVIDFIKEKDDNRPEKQYDEKEKEELLTETIDRLNQQEKLVISLFYYEELTQKEIAEVMELSAARISQIHKKAVYRLRGMLGKKKALLI